MSEVTFDYFESEKVKRTIKNESGKISFKTEAPRFFNWVFNQYVLKIGIPEVFNGKLEIKTKIGSVLVDLNTATCKEMDIECTTGNVIVKNAAVKEGFSAKVTTGNAEINGVASNNFSIESTTGSVIVNDVKVSKNVDLKATTDSLSFKVNNATKIYLKATTGNISGEIVGNMKDFNIESSTSTGKNNLKNQMVPASDKLIKDIRFLDDMPFIGGKKNSQSRGVYDSIALFANYEAVSDKPSFEELSAMNNETFVPTMQKLGFLNLNRSWVLRLEHYIFASIPKKAKKHEQEWVGNYHMTVRPCDTEKGIYYEFTSCPIADFAKRHGYTELMPAFCNPDYPMMKAMHGGLIRRSTCTNGERCE